MRRKTRAKETQQVRCTVRMYCHGLGDCFLVSIPQTGKDRPYWLMIDAGVLLGTSDSSDRMKQVLQSIHDTTGGHLDLLVVSHQHWDHVSGFAQAEEIFEKLQIDKVWYAWTEDPNDPVGVELQKTRSKAAFAVEQALTRMDDNSSLKLGITDLMNAFGVDRKGSPSTAEAMKLPGELFTAEYRKPGETIIEAGVRFHILGPPRDERIFRSDPSKKSPEVYESDTHKLHAFGLGQSMGMIEAVEGIRSDAESDLTRPFDSQHCRPLDAVTTEFPNYQDQALEWRNIDNDWEGIVGQLALQLDSDTNNTSLAFAIEIPDSGQVLIFPADAQVGNWLSWHDQTWTVKDGDTSRTLTARELLSRTVFYKAGHHGSHNATMREKGLEMMISPDLCAMIPVEVETAKKKKWFEMPLKTLVTRLSEKTNGKVAVADDPTTFKAPFRPSSEMNNFVNPPRPLYVEVDISSRVPL